jgi:hypothetical protein
MYFDYLEGDQYDEDELFAGDFFQPEDEDKY